jgi:hypothetical protein
MPLAMRAALVCVVGMSVACRDAVVPPATQPAVLPTAHAGTVLVRDCVGPATSVPAELAAAIPPRTGKMVPDDRWADLAATVPGGFAGFFLRNGQPVIQLARPAEEAEAKAALAPLYPHFPVAGASVQHARWDFAQLVDWFNYLSGETPLWSHNVTSGDKDELLNRLVFGVADSASLVQVQVMLESLPVPCRLVVLRIQPPIVSR